VNYEEFIENYRNFTGRALEFEKKARMEGLLSLEHYFDPEKIRTRDVFEYGLRFAIDGTDPEIINKILTNIIDQDKDEYSHLLKTIQKEAVLIIQAGMNSRYLSAIMNSFTDLPLTEDEIK